MTNHLKFRIWDRALSQWVEEDVSGTHAFTETFLTLNGVVQKFDGCYLSENEASYIKQPIKEYIRGKWWLSSERYIIQQFTGLIDIEGKEIYEGDVISMAGSGEHEIFFRSGSFMYWIDNVSYLELSQSCFLNSLEITGNIFKK